MDRTFRFGGGPVETYVHPAIAVGVLLACVLIFLVHRKYVVVPFLAAALLIPMDQVIVAGPFHFQMLRVLILFGWIRVLLTKLSSGRELFRGRMNSLDKAISFLIVSSACMFILLWQEWGAVTNQLGTVYTVFGVYFLLRFFIRDDEDVDNTIRTFAYIAVVIAVVMAIEQTTGHNPYAVFGGPRAIFRENGIERYNHFRAMGPFGHPILAGTFGGILLPLFVGLWWKSRKNRVIALAGGVAATLIVITSSSSTSLLGYAAGILALGLWPLRKQMRLIRWGLFLSLVSLHMVMKAPVWALIARVGLVPGSSSYHRYVLLDQFIRHFGDWWLWGAKNNSEWGWFTWDLANQYVAVGEVSGLLPFIVFLAVIALGFRKLGVARRASAGNKRQELFFWALGAGLFSNVVAFFGISYFDQTMVAWYALLAMISVATASRIAQPVEQAEVQLVGDMQMSYTSVPTSRSTESGLLHNHGRQFHSSS